MTDSPPEDLEAFAEKLQRVFLEEALRVYGKRVVDFWWEPRNMGPLEDADGRARVTGPCGDTMEFFLKFEGERIERATFLTDGCGPTIASGGAATELARGKTPAEALGIDHGAVLEMLGGLPEESVHCARLAAMTLGAAVEDYLGRVSGQDPPTPQHPPTEPTLEA